MQDKHSELFFDWIPNSIKASVCDVPPTRPKVRACPSLRTAATTRRDSALVRERVSVEHVVVRELQRATDKRDRFRVRVF